MPQHDISIAPTQPLLPGDIHPGVASAYDDEFEAPTIDAKWVWRNQGSAVITQAYGRQTLKVPAGDTAVRARIREQIAPVGDFTLSAKIAVMFGGGTSQESGLCFVNNSNGRLLTLDVSLFSALHVKLVRWTDTSTPSTSVIDISAPPYLMPDNFYLRLVVASSVITPWSSHDGVNWTKFSGTTESVATHIGSIDRIGFFVSGSDANSDAFLSLEWFRVTTP